MPADIRSFFLPKAQSSKSKNDSSRDSRDSDVIPSTPTPKKAKPRKKQRILSDSEESDEEFKKRRTSPRKQQKPPPPPPKKEVRALDIFGSAPAKRVASDKKDKKENKEKKADDEPENSKKTNGTEASIHEHDADFQKTLIALDDSKKDTKKSKSDTKNGESNKEERPKVKTPIKKDPKESTEKTTKESASNISSSSSNLDKKKTLSKNNVDFSTFINDDAPKTPQKSEAERHTNKTPTADKNRKRKLSESTPEITDEERMERKRHSALLYKNFLNRSGPKNHGAKEVPKGTPNCLKECSFLVTGVLDSFEREEIASIVKEFGGEMKQTISGKVTHMICGEDAGPAKIAKAEKLKVKIISEDEFLELIKTRSQKADAPKESTKHRDKSSKSDSAKSSKRSEKRDREENGEKSSEAKRKNDSSKSHSPAKKHKSSHSKEEESKTKTGSPCKKDANSDLHKRSKSSGKVKESPKKNGETSGSPRERKEERRKLDEVKLTNGVGKFYSDNTSKEQFTSDKDNAESKPSTSNVDKPADNRIPWVEKYRPKTLKQVIGQHGDASCANKLLSWMTKWYQCRKTKQPAPNPWSKGDGGYYKAALLSGPPGVGKTTTANLVCKELGFDVVEFNASDTRSKNLLKEQITEMTTTNSLAGFVHGKKALTKKHAIIMDEVDGMAGNEDRGGMQELLSLIKHTSVPIICICNDKTLQKMKSLVSNCYDINFNRPKVEQIRGAIKSICFKEGIKIPPDYLDEMIKASSQDMRQIINNLSLWSVKRDPSKMNDEEESRVSKKDMKMGPWAVVRTVFTEDEHKGMTLNERSDLFFHDYSLGPLFVQQNYLKVVPHCPKKEYLSRFAEAADSLSAGDLVDAKIRSGMMWSLLPVQAMYSSVIPGARLSGHIQGTIDFPGWLGQNSRANKMHRLTQEIHSHTRLSTTGSKQSIQLDYAPHIRNAILDPLVESGVDGVDRSVQVLQDYHLLREDLDSLLELSTWSGKANKMAGIDPKVKTALTKKYNKEAAPLPYTLMTIKKSKSTLSDRSEDAAGEELADENVDDEGGQSDEDVDNDAMIKKAKKSAPSTVVKAKDKGKKRDTKAKAGSSKKK